MKNNDPSAKANKSNMVTFRITEKASDELDLIKAIIQKQRGPGASNVTRTEVIQILIQIGAQNFLSNSGDGEQTREEDDQYLAFSQKFLEEEDPAFAEMMNRVQKETRDED